MTEPLTGRFAGLPTARPEALGLSRSGLKRLTQVMEREIAAGRAPGAALLIARHGKVGFAQALGALKPGGPDMPLDALFRIYSMTKPIVTVAAMGLVEEGRLFLADPLAKFIPAFGRAKVGDEARPLERPITIHDLMRHTSGLAYGFTGASEGHRRVRQGRFVDAQRSSAEMADALAALPLLHQPGTAFEYGLSTDVLGRVVEIVEQASLADVLRKRVFEPLAMDDTAFFTPPEKLARRAEPPNFDLLDAAGVDRIDMTFPPPFPMGGTGLISTLGDYARFAAMLSGGGVLDSARVLGPRTVAFMACDHLGPRVNIPVALSSLLPPGHGFGLGFAVRTEPGLAPTSGSVGDHFWGGVAGTSFWISPRDALFAILMVQAPDHRDHFRQLFRSVVNAAVL